jgi:hypothetical protein
LVKEQGGAAADGRDAAADWEEKCRPDTKEGTANGRHFREVVAPLCFLDKALETFVFDVDGKLAQAAEKQDAFQEGMREISAKLREVWSLTVLLRCPAHEGLFSEL